MNIAVSANRSRTLLPWANVRRFRIGEGSECVQDQFERPVRVAQDVVVPETEDGEPLAFQPPSAFGILRRLNRMLSAIHLDDQPALMTNEVDDEAADRGLPSKVQAIHLMAAQAAPKAHFGVRRVLPHTSGVWHRHLSIIHHELKNAALAVRIAPLPNPPPQRGEGTLVARSRSSFEQRSDQWAKRPAGPVSSRSA